MALTRTSKLILGALLLSGLPSAAHSMTVSTFLSKVEALQKKGAMALFSSDVGLLKKEGMTAGKAIRAEQIAALKAGRKPTMCMPKGAGINSNEVIAHFRSIPAAQRGMTVKTGLEGLMRKKFPCPA